MRSFTLLAIVLVMVCSYAAYTISSVDVNTQSNGYVSVYVECIDPDTEMQQSATIAFELQPASGFMCGSGGSGGTFPISGQIPCNTDANVASSLAAGNYCITVYGVTGNCTGICKTTNFFTIPRKQVVSNIPELNVLIIPAVLSYVLLKIRKGRS